MNKFDAQQARRILDRLVGYEISPLLWNEGPARAVGRPRAVGRGAPGRRARGGDRGVHARGVLDGRGDRRGRRRRRRSTSRLAKVDGKKAELNDEGQAREVVDELSARRRSWSRRSSARSGARTRRRRSSPRSCSRRRRASCASPPKRTMALAQRLYEGVELGDEGPVGLITYMRTDSTRISDDAVDRGARVHRRDVRRRRTCRTSRSSTRRKKSAQDAHEAIRPTLAGVRPGDGARAVRARQGGGRDERESRTCSGSTR